MTTVRGFLRSYGAAVRRIEREQQRKAREAARRFKEQQKLQAINDAKQAVADWEHYVDTLQSIHKNCTNSVDWNSLQKMPDPTSPARSAVHESTVRRKIYNYKPSVVDKLLGATQKKIDQLNALLNEAIQKDEEEYKLACEQYQKEIDDWNQIQSITEGIENKDSASYIEALHYLNPLADLGELGIEVTFSVEGELIDIYLHANSEEIIPDYELKMTSTGKLSKKAMPKSRFYELYQDHVCSSVIRVAREVFAYLPVDHVRINATTMLLNSATGYLEDKPILSVIIPLATIDLLNLNAIDPSDSMQNFIHNMKFKKTTGFTEVEKVVLAL